ncbi:MAG TPA: YidB family protein [Burkholderiaceae bacterium]|nr:YidB family protein [Burkholderiaceae bacterium]
MNLLEQILGGMAGQSGTQAASKQNALLEMAMQFVRNYPGGLPGLLQAFGAAGFGKQAQSWVGTGQNLPISPDVIAQIFGGQLQSMGDRLGLDSREAAGGLASLLPELVDKATPNGQLEEDRMQGDDLGALLNSVRGKLLG